MSDAVLWNSMKEGSISSLETIYNNEIAFLVNYGVSIHRDTALVEDCIHELFVEIWQHKETISATDSIRKYLLVSLRRKIIKAIGKEAKVEDITQDITSEQLNSESAIIQNETELENNALVHSALELLPARQREIIQLKFFQDRSYEEICSIMEINYQAARNMVSKALRNLQSAVFSNTS